MSFDEKMRYVAASVLRDTKNDYCNPYACAKG